MKHHLYWIDEKGKNTLIHEIRKLGYICLDNETIIAVFDMNNDVMASLYFIEDPAPEHMGEVCMFYCFNRKIFTTKKMTALESLLHDLMIESGARDYLTMLPQ
jgi:hypothetical protein